MSVWRREASRRLPELQSTIASRDISTPGELWITLQLEFDRLCHQTPPPVELLSRIWEYAKWCAEQSDEAISTAVVSFFFEQLQDTRTYRKVLPMLMSDSEYAQYTESDKRKR